MLGSTVMSWFAVKNYSLQGQTLLPLGPHVFVALRYRKYQTIPSPYYCCYQQIVLGASRVIPPFMEHISSAKQRNQSLEEIGILIIVAKFLRRFLDRTFKLDNVSAN